MKKILLLLFCFPLISISQNSILINESQVSIFKVRDKVPNVGLINEFTISMQEEVFYGEGDGYYLDVYFVFSDSDTIISIISDNYNKDIINEILIFYKKPRTKEGIGVGSTIENFALQYNAYSIWCTYISDVCVIETRKYNNIQFILNISDLKDGSPGLDFNGMFISDMTSLEISDFFPQTKIN
jgi:hypothetical protein